MFLDHLYIKMRMVSADCQPWTWYQRIGVFKLMTMDPPQDSDRRLRSLRTERGVERGAAPLLGRELRRERRGPGVGWRGGRPPCGTWGNKKMWNTHGLIQSLGLGGINMVKRDYTPTCFLGGTTLWLNGFLTGGKMIYKWWAIKHLTLISNSLTDNNNHVGMFFLSFPP